MDLLRDVQIAFPLGRRLREVWLISATIEGAGVFSDGANTHVKEWVESFRPMKRMGTVEDVANAAEYLASDLSAFVSGQHLLLSGGAHC